jgi:hypothetical protein
MFGIEVDECKLYCAWTLSGATTSCQVFQLPAVW